MKAIDLFTGLDDFIRYADGLLPDTTYEQLAPSIRAVTLDIMDLITAEVYIVLSGVGDDGDPLYEGLEFLKSADRARAEMLEQTKGELCDLSVAIAEKIIHISLKSSREVIGRMIQVAAEKLKRREWVHIYIGGVDTRTAAQIAPELTASLAGLSDHIKIIPMAEDESGTCILEMPDEIIDASVSTQLQNIRDLMGEA